MDKLMQCDKYNQGTSEKTESRSPGWLFLLNRHRVLTKPDTWPRLHGRAAQYNQLKQKSILLLPPLYTCSTCLFLWSDKLLWWYFLYLTLKTDRGGTLDLIVRVPAAISLPLVEHLNECSCQNTWPSGFASNLFEVKRRGRERRREWL